MSFALREADFYPIEGMVCNFVGGQTKAGQRRDGKARCQLLQKELFGLGLPVLTRVAAGCQLSV